MKTSTSLLRTGILAPLLVLLLVPLYLPATVHALTTCFGDSITYGIGGGGETYPRFLSDFLAGNGKSPAVTNRGIAGEDTASGLRRFQSVLNADNPKYVCILEGTNDIYVGI
ncbi:MAG: GDSL-type esterase/lipase family protein, partial [Desulfobacteraceae bacterium]|nr:GDSL-type esterase/lipase family protein [Desulfobacteraceae bacterium]